MKIKAACKAGVDIAMTALFLGQMGYHLMDNRLHEWTGAALCLLFLAHHALNGGWHRRLFKGRYTPQRTLLTVVDGLLMLAMIAVLASAVLVSRHVFDFLGLRLRAVGRRIHMPATMWAFVLTGLHLGLHWNRMLNAARRAAKGKGGRAAMRMARVLLLGVCAFGVYSFIARGLYMELFMLREFAFLAYGESLVTFVAAYIAVWAALGAAAYALSRLLNGRMKGGIHVKKALILICVSAMALAVPNACWALAEADDMVLISGGVFQMGSPAEEPWRSEDENLHSVAVGSFYMSAHEFTQREYEALMGVNPSAFPGAENPVENVTWYDAVACCNARSAAARGTTLPKTCARPIARRCSPIWPRSTWGCVWYEMRTPCRVPQRHSRTDGSLRRPGIAR